MADRIGTSFLEEAVVDLYRYRPPYPAGVFDLLTRLAPAHDRLLDLGCGTGKIARPLSQRFAEVTAVDPSAAMIALGQSLENGQADNLTWVQATGEDAPLDGAYDVIVAALSIHWMDHGVIFPKLARHARPDTLFAVVQGDDAHDPPWAAEWQGFLAKWVPLLTGKPVHQGQNRDLHEEYLDHVEVIDVHRILSEPHRQSIEDFLLCQHSRETFALSKLGARRAEFDNELRQILAPYADPQGMLSFHSRAKVTIARITPDPAAR